MNLITSRSIVITAPVSDVWAVISDIENATQHISAINKIEVLDQGAQDSIAGLKWQETRQWMGRDAVEVMWVTDTDDALFYETRAESHGCIYQSRLTLADTPAGTELTMAFYCQPESTGAKVMWLLTGWMAKRSLRKIIDQDLQDIKNAVEKS